MQDRFGREINYLRISVTDSCNMNCRYCRPVGEPLKEHSLSLKEIETIAEAAAGAGFKYIRLTGGEPLVRDDIADIVSSVKSINGIEDVSVTTNGLKLDEKLGDLAEAGLDGVNISIDTLDRDVFKSITGVDGLLQVQRGLDHALAIGDTSGKTRLRVRINTVLINGINEDAYKELVKLTIDRPVDVRFIELMPIGEGISLEGPSNEEVLRAIKRDNLLEKAKRTGKDTGPAEYYTIKGAAGRIGFISAVHKSFCKSCNRLRVTSDGRLKLCLCYGDALDIMPAFEESPETSELKIEELMKKAIEMKPGRHCFDEPELITEKEKMYSIGG